MDWMGVTVTPLIVKLASKIMELDAILQMDIIVPQMIELIFKKWVIAPQQTIYLVGKI